MSEETEEFSIKCELCPGKKIDNIANHLRRHVKCSKCNRRSCTVGSDHCTSIKKYPNEKILKCPKCDYTAEKVNQIRRHFHTHQADVWYNCSKCDFRSRQKQSLIRHNKLEHTNKETLKCSHPMCSYETKRQDNLTRHMRTKHRDLPKNEFYCEICGNKFTSQQALKLHLIIHQAGKNTFKCRFCENKTFNTAQAAHSHEKRFHGEHGFTKCSYCPRIFRNSPEGTRFITRHIRGHARKFEKCKYQCQNAKNGKNSNCIFGTDSKEELEKHQKDCSMRTSVIAPNPHFKTLLRSVIVDRSCNPFYFHPPSDPPSNDAIQSASRNIQIADNQTCVIINPPILAKKPNLIQNSNLDHVYSHDDSIYEPISDSGDHFCITEHQNQIIERDLEIERDHFLPRDHNDVLPDFLHESFQMRNEEPFISQEDNFLSVGGSSPLEGNNNLENDGLETDGPFIPGGFGRLGGYFTGQTGNEPMVMSDYIMDTDRDWIDSDRLDIMNDQPQEIDISWDTTPKTSWETGQEYSRIVPNRTQAADRVQVIVSKKPENSVIVSPPHLHQLLLH